MGIYFKDAFIASSLILSLKNTFVLDVLEDVIYRREFNLLVVCQVIVRLSMASYTISKAME